MISAKNIFVGLLSFVLILSVSTAVASLAFTLTINERTLSALVSNYIEPFIDEQTESAISKWGESEIQSRHQTALFICQTSEYYEIGRQGGKTVNIGCDKISDTSTEIFLQNIKSEIKRFAMSEINNSLKQSEKYLTYMAISLWTSTILSLVLIILIVVLSRAFPFKKFGVVGLIAGSPALFIFLTKSFALNKVNRLIQNSFSPESIESVSHSVLFEGISGFISNFFVVLILGFLVIFLLGFILLIVGFLKSRQT